MWAAHMTQIAFTGLAPSPCTTSCAIWVYFNIKKKCIDLVLRFKVPMKDCPKQKVSGYKYIYCLANVTPLYLVKHFFIQLVFENTLFILWVHSSFSNVNFIPIWDDDKTKGYCVCICVHVRMCSDNRKVQKPSSVS